jgi:hypothetical protein
MVNSLPTLPIQKEDFIMISTSEKTNQNRGMPGWLELYDLSLHGDMEARIPLNAYIRGLIGGEKKFSPGSEVIGKAIPKPEGQSESRMG